MLSTDDREFIRRDPSIAGLATVLDLDAFLAALRSCLPNADFESGRITYVKYKFGTNCLVGYRLHAPDRSVDLYAKAYARRAEEKLQEASKRPNIPGPFGPGGMVLPDAGIEVRFFPNDAELDALRFVAGDDLNRDLLQRVLPDRRHLWDTPLRCLAYKPERRYVAGLVAGEEDGAVLRVYAEPEYESALLAASAFASRELLRTPRRLGRSKRFRIIVQEWLPGCPLSEALGDAELPLRTVEQVGAALAELHQQNPKNLPIRSSAEEEEALVAVAKGIGEVCPHLAERARALAEWLAVRLVRVSHTTRPIHGDFYAEQVLLADERVAILDLDQAARWDPALDLGNFVAHLERDALCGRLLPDRVEPATTAFLDGYRRVGRQPNLDRVLRCTVAGLLRLAAEPFRHREPDWRENTEAILERAEDVLFSTSPTSFATVGGFGKHRQTTHGENRTMATTSQGEFVREDGKSLRVLPGFRQWALNYRSPITPKEHWSDEDYGAAAHKKIKRGRRLIEQIARWRGTLDGAEVLDIGCGDGFTAIIIALQPVRSVTGIDLELKLFAPGKAGERARRLIHAMLKELDVPGTLDEALKRLPLELTTMDARSLPLADDSLDLLLTRSAVEHIRPIDQALFEIARVVRPGGLIHHSIDPFYWLRGCHKRGVVDIPWAHARLSLEEYHRFVTESEGEIVARKRSRRLETLNRFTLREWRAIVASEPFELLDWKEDANEFAESILEQHSDVADTLLDGVEPEDLINGRAEVWLRNGKQPSEPSACDGETRL